MSSGPPAARGPVAAAWPTALQHAALLLVITAGVSVGWLVARDEPPEAAALHVPVRFAVTSLVSDAAAAPPQTTGAFVAGLPIELAAASEVRSAFSLAVEAAALRATASQSGEIRAALAASVPVVPANVASARATAAAPALASVAASAAPASAATDDESASTRIGDAAATAAPAIGEAVATTTPALDATASRHASLAELEAALARSRWPAELWARVISIAGCESGTDTNRDGQPDHFDNLAVGSGGTTYGVMQVHRGHRFAQALDLFTLDDNLEAAFVVWERAGGSFAPWGCR